LVSDLVEKMAKPVLLIRGTGNDSDALALSKLGVSSLVDPYLKIAVSDETKDAFDLFNSLVESLGTTWLIATSVNAIRFWAEIVGSEKLAEAISRRGMRYAAIGQATSNALVDLGATDVLTPQDATSASLITSLLEYPPSTAIIPGGNLAMINLPRNLRTAGWTVRSGVVYTTSPVSQEPKSVSLVRSGDIAAVLCRSPSAVRAFLAHVPKPEIPIICSGPTTARAAMEFGIRVDAIAEDPTPDTVAATIVSLLTRRNSWT
jgi:uroporphyrinogen-III synthase